MEKKNKNNAADEKEKNITDAEMQETNNKGKTEAAESKSLDQSGDDDAYENERRSEDRRKEERRKQFRRKSDREKALKQDVADFKDENDRLKEEIESLKDTLLRRHADFENYKKRVSKQQSDMKKLIIKDFALDIILINDDLLRAIEASSNITDGGSTEEAHKSFVEGVSMISKRIEETLGTYGIEEVDSLDKEFDPNFMEAVEIEMSEGVDKDTVTKVYQKGFRIDDMAVRSAKVKVAKPLRSDNGEK